MNETPEITADTAVAAPTMEVAAKEVHKATNRSIHAWATGAIGNYWMYSTLGQLDFPLKTTFGVKPWIMGLAMAAPRIVDGLLDPLLGHLSDITHTRWGRRRPWLLGSGIIGAFLVIAIWWLSPGWPWWGHLVFLTTMCVLLFSTWGTYDMSHTALGYELSDDYNQRSKVMAVRNAWFSLAALGGGFFYTIALILKDGVQWKQGTEYKILWGLFTVTVPEWLARHSIPAAFPGDEITAIRTIAYVVGGMVLVFGCLPFFICRERFAEANRSHVNIWKALRAALQNRPFRLILIMRILGTLGGVVSPVGGMVIYYYVCNGEKLQATGILGGIAGVIGLATALVMVPLAVPLTKRLGKRTGILIGCGATVVSAGIMPFIVMRGQPWVLLLPGILFAIPNAIGGTMMASAIPDICDLDEVSSGERREGLYTAVGSFVSKLEVSAIMLVGNLLITWCGCDPMLSQQPEHVVTLMRWVWLTPGILLSSIIFVLACFYPLTEKVMDDVHARLQERRKASAAAPA